MNWPDWEQPHPELDWDNCGYIGDTKTGVYYGAVSDGVNWWGMVEMDSGGDVSIESMTGPFNTEDEAETSAQESAMRWAKDAGFDMSPDELFISPYEEDDEGVDGGWF